VFVMVVPKGRAFRRRRGYHARVDRRIADDIARGWELLETGDLEGAQRAHAQARRAVDNARKRGKVPPDLMAELHGLRGAIAEHEGDAETAMEAYRHAHERAPREPRYLLWAAELALSAFDDPDTAVHLCNKVMDVVTDDDVLVQAILLKAEALIGLGEGEGEDEEARDLLTELAGCTIEDPEVWCRAGDIYLALGELDQAERSYQAALGLEADWADAHHGLGLVYAERGDHDRMIRSWLKVRALDLADEPSPLHMDLDAFEKVAEAALAELPEKARTLLENVPVLIDDMPSEELIAEGTDPRLLGLFTGVPLPEKSTASNQVPQIDAIYLFQRNLENASYSPEHLAEEIRITVLHETAHFFGLEDDDLGSIGLG
jgi:predicted Zn-dependent protease with MMP-like domain/Flp pilus assembly protein TadD